MKKTACRNSGFTIIELLVVIVVIAALAALVYGGYAAIQSRTQMATKRQTVSTIDQKMQKYFSINGAYPASAASVLSDEKYLQQLAGTSIQTGGDPCNDRQKVCLAWSSSDVNAGTGYGVLYWNSEANVWYYQVQKFTAGNGQKIMTTYSCGNGASVATPNSSCTTVVTTATVS